MMMVPIRAPASSSSSYRHVPVSSVYEYVQGEPFTLISNPTPTAPASIGRSNMGPPAATRSETQFITQISPPQSDIPPRRKRASKPKVKTGCITCKIRHVKCDEEKPACKKCTSTGRKCDGYEKPIQDADNNQVRRPSMRDLATTRQTGIQLPSSMTLVFQGTVQERQTFHRFQQLTIPALAGGSEADFWYSLVLKAGVAEPVIRTAIIALGTLHEDYQSRRGQYNANLIQEPSYQRALSLYGKALRQLNDRLASSQGDSAKLAIISSILFTCFEILRRNDMTAIVHYRAGMRELMRHMKLRSHGPVSAGSGDDGANQITVRQIPQDELDILLRVFARYDVQACTFAKPRAEPLAADLPSLPPTTLTLKDVRHHLDNLLIACYQLINHDSGIFRYLHPSNVPVDWQMNIKQQLQIFQAWHDALEKFFSTSEIQLPPSDAKSLLGLRLQLKVAIMMLKTSINCGPESCFDQYKPEFEQMVSAVERVTQSLALTDAEPLDREVAPFTMELGIVHPLFFIATKCRDQRLRRRAIAQLRKAGKEGVWEGPIMAVVAKKMMQIEQRGLLPGQSVPEANRIHKIQKTVDYDGRKVMIEMTLAQDDSWERWETIRDAIPF